MYSVLAFVTTVSKEPPVVSIRNMSLEIKKKKEKKNLNALCNIQKGQRSQASPVPAVGLSQTGLHRCEHNAGNYLALKAVQTENTCEKILHCLQQGLKKY